MAHAVWLLTEKDFFVLVSGKTVFLLPHTPTLTRFKQNKDVENLYAEIKIIKTKPKISTQKGFITIK